MRPPVVKGVTGHFLDVPIEEAVRLAKDAAKGADVVVLGANVARQCLEADALDEIIVHVAPVLVGDGVRLFERAGGEVVRLERVASMDEVRRLCSAARSGRLAPKAALPLPREGGRLSRLET